MTIKNYALLLIVTTSIVVLGTSCQSPQAKPVAENFASLSTRNNCYSLLHQLTEQEKDVSILRFIKREHSDVKELVKRIAKTSGAASKQLEEFAKKDPTLKLDDYGLPPGEKATRDAIASTKQKVLLGQKGDEFELSLLLSQTEALSYAWHLAKVAGENDPQPDRAAALSGISSEMEKLYHEVFALLLTKEGASSSIKNSH